MSDMQRIRDLEGQMIRITNAHIVISRELHASNARVAALAAAIETLVATVKHLTVLQGAPSEVEEESPCH